MKKYILDLPETFTAKEALTLNGYLVDHQGNELKVIFGFSGASSYILATINGQTMAIPKKWIKIVDECESGFEKWSSKNPVRFEAGKYGFDELKKEREKAWNAGQRELWNRLESIGAILKEPF